MVSKAHILIIKLGALGDVILATPHIKRIVEAHPDARVTLLTAPEYAVLVQGHPGLEVVTFRRRGLAEMLRVIAWLRRSRFGVVYDLQGSLRSRIMTHVSGAGRRIGRRPAGVYTRTPAMTGGDLHACDELNRLLEAAGIDSAPPQAWLPDMREARARVTAWLRVHGLQDARYVILHAGSSARWPSKRWAEAHYTELARALEARGCRVVWIGDEAERALNRRLARQAGLDAAGEFSLLELLALGQLAGFAVVNDSGPMHVLSAAAIPVYAFFGPTDWRRSHAPGQAARVIAHPVPCSPCHLPVCPPERGHQCLNAITPAMVLSRIEEDGHF